jgi:uncharacterized protein (TIGR03086 family)
MTTDTATTVLTGGVALLERATGYTLGGLSLVSPDAMRNPTPCARWDLRALLVHLNDSLQALYEAIAVGRVGLDPAAPAAGAWGDPSIDPVRAARTRAARMIGAWANAHGPGDISIADLDLSAGVVAATGAIELAVHGWDVSRACGHDRPIPPALADELYELSLLLVIDADRPTRFATPVDVSPLATPSERLLAHLGRHPS